MLAASVDPALVVVLVVAALLLLVATVALRRRAARTAVPSTDSGAPVASPDTDLTLPSVERSDGSAPHGAPVAVEPTTPEPVAAPGDIWERTHRTRSLFGDAFRRIRSRSAVGPDTWDELEET
ncbi:MAG: hypothetical protein ACKOFF_04910, partial [Acidimicrobiales bacterium]